MVTLYAARLHFRACSVTCPKMHPRNYRPDAKIISANFLEGRAGSAAVRFGACSVTCQQCPSKNYVFLSAPLHAGKRTPRTTARPPLAAPLAAYSVTVPPLPVCYWILLQRNWLTPLPTLPSLNSLSATTRAHISAPRSQANQGHVSALLFLLN